MFSQYLGNCRAEKLKETGSCASDNVVIVRLGNSFVPGAGKLPAPGWIV